jgi:hypothetical protein
MFSHFGYELTNRIEQTRASSSSTTGILPRRPWTPPNPAIHSYFYDGLEVSDRSHSIPRATASPITPVPDVSRHISAKPPQELVAADARGPREIEQAMKFQLDQERIRERIREEEVKPLEQRLRVLETLINTTLHGHSNISPPPSDGGGSAYFDDTPLISFDESSNPTRAGTVRQENRKLEDDSTVGGPQDS